MNVVQQPTQTSCGPAVAAMVCGEPVSCLIMRLRQVRSASRKRIKNERTNIGEMRQLLHAFGWTFGRRIQATSSLPGEHSLALLRVQHPQGYGWHWMLLKHGVVYDPASGTRVIGPLAPASRVSWYEVEKAPKC